MGGAVARRLRVEQRERRRDWDRRQHERRPGAQPDGDDIAYGIAGRLAFQVAVKFAWRH